MCHGYVRALNCTKVGRTWRVKMHRMGCTHAGRLSDAHFCGLNGKQVGRLVILRIGRINRTQLVGSVVYIASRGASIRETAAWYNANSKGAGEATSSKRILRL